MFNVTGLVRTAEAASEDGVRIQAELTRRNIGIVAIRESIDTREGSAAAKFFRRSMLAQGAYQVDSASERIRLGLGRARASGKRVGRPPVLSQEQAEKCQLMAAEGAGLRQIARVMGCSPATVKKVLAPSQRSVGFLFNLASILPN